MGKPINFYSYYRRYNLSICNFKVNSYFFSDSYLLNSFSAYTALYMSLAQHKHTVAPFGICSSMPVCSLRHIAHLHLLFFMATILSSDLKTIIWDFSKMECCENF